MKIIEIENLSFQYDRAPVLENLSLSINKGEFIGIFGPNGGGKTTFLKLLLGFLKSQVGKIVLMTSKIGYVPQIARFDRQFPISVLDIALMGLIGEASWWGGYRSDARARALEALERVGLKDLENRAFGTLSGGQAQRVLIARAIVNEPELLILDEPTANVDPRAEEEIFTLLNELKPSKTILLVTHDLQNVLKKSDRLLCIQRNATFYLPSQVCGHFSMGLYHPKEGSP